MRLLKIRPKNFELGQNLYSDRKEQYQGMTILLKSALERPKSCFSLR